MSKKLTERAVIELTDLAMDRCGVVMRDVLQLIYDPQQKMILSTNVAALMFGMAARFLQHHWYQKDGNEPEFSKAVDAVVFHVAKLAVETPPEPVSLQERAD
jgi:hypothetical protein